MKPRAALALLALTRAALYSQEAAPSPAPPPAATPPPIGEYHLKSKSSFGAPPTARAPFVPIGWVKKNGPVVVAQQATVDESAFRVTSILLGNPSLAVINGRPYEEGQFLRMPRGGPQVLIRVYRIGDGKVWLQYGDKVMVAPLKRPEIGERKVEEPLLNEDRDIVPMPVAPPGAGAVPVPVLPPAAPAAPAPAAPPTPPAPPAPPAPKLR